MKVNIFLSLSKSNLSSRTGQFLIAMVACTVLTQPAWAQITFDTQFSNIDSIANTRHNLSLRYMTSGGAQNPTLHNAARNQYGEVCVYCHTPHGANLANGLTAPLWNRTIKVTNYQTYDELGTMMTQTVTSTPGSASLTCLSCHDGQTAIDSIINMPGAFRKQVGQASQDTTQNIAFLNSWTNTGGGLTKTTIHRGINSSQSTAGGYVLGNGTGSDNAGCMTCHSPVGFAAVNIGTEANDMRLFNLGTDLRNDHPIGVTFPVNNGGDTGWNTPAGVKGTSLYFDTDGDTIMDKAEIRTYEGKVECASCHDPHGVPGPTGVFKKTFLRVDNSAGSAVCLTCHNK